jgi:hypothetical protein
MDPHKKKKLEAKLREMIETNKPAPTQSDHSIQNTSRLGNVIRRRKGEKDKRILVLNYQGS